MQSHSYKPTVSSRLWRESLWRNGIRNADTHSSRRQAASQSLRPPAGWRGRNKSNVSSDHLTVRVRGPVYECLQSWGPSQGISLLVMRECLRLRETENFISSDVNILFFSQETRTTFFNGFANWDHVIQSRDIHHDCLFCTMMICAMLTIFCIPNYFSVVLFKSRSYFAEKSSRQSA